MSPPASPPPLPGVPKESWYKNRLQQYTHRASMPLPIYETFNEGAQHASKFRSRVWVDGVCFTSPNTFSNRKASEQDAAKHALIGLREKVKNEGSSRILANATFCKSIINEYAVKMNIDLPSYLTNESKELSVPVFGSSLNLGGVTYVGAAGRNRKEAEQFAARSAILSILESESDTTMSEIVRSKFRFYDAKTVNNSAVVQLDTTPNEVQAKDPSSDNAPPPEVNSLENIDATSLINKRKACNDDSSSVNEGNMPAGGIPLDEDVGLNKRQKVNSGTIPNVVNPNPLEHVNHSSEGNGETLLIAETGNVPAGEIPLEHVIHSSESNDETLLIVETGNVPAGGIPLEHVDHSSENKDETLLIAETGNVPAGGIPLEHVDHSSENNDKTLLIVETGNVPAGGIQLEHVNHSSEGNGETLVNVETGNLPAGGIPLEHVNHSSENNGETLMIVETGNVPAGGIPLEHVNHSSEDNGETVLVVETGNVPAGGIPLEHVNHSSENNGDTLLIAETGNVPAGGIPSEHVNHSSENNGENLPIIKTEVNANANLQHSILAPFASHEVMHPESSTEPSGTLASSPVIAPSPSEQPISAKQCRDSSDQSTGFIFSG
ncbi:hypothetical protein ABFS82_12G026000 [Erythranthe guttata]|uniref:DRBM domain-containing protein n=1 Tax=Erythranthe guttata TaxID=4155 RepID=A0A022RMN4_ERYGU|nr:PREDICTED: uncharacterized protein LOC105953480 [Erythranthe guttata]EYU41334.1 hypothetical protein MIMGU_mgv1a003102mg [Erythranthe guttata]|eukprot:XP_012832598.1 PREDICTED: uncharacterized protein LOC105953480 [Erythranthe guttata]